VCKAFRSRESPREIISASNDKERKKGVPTVATTARSAVPAQSIVLKLLKVLIDDPTRTYGKVDEDEHPGGPPLRLKSVTKVNTSGTFVPDA
jgi:hypothetical protein